MESILSCDYETKKIGDFTLRNIHFEVKSGYITGIIGSNGAGKSTLIRQLLQKHKDQMAFVLTDCPFPLELSAKDNGILYGGYYKDFNYGQYRELCQKYEVPFTRPLKKLSKGQQIKMQLAFALSRAVKLYVFDEPTGNLDVKFRDTLYEIMRDLTEKEEKSILYVTHLVEELETLADYVLWLEEGRQMYYGTLESLLDQYRLYFGDCGRLEENGNCNVIFQRENDNHRESLLYSKNGTFSDLVNADSRRATLKEILYYEKEARGGFRDKEYIVRNGI